MGDGISVALFYFHAWYQGFLDRNCSRIFHGPRYSIDEHAPLPLTGEIEEPISGALGLPIVLDTGLHSVKAGFAGDEEPKVEFRSVIGRPRHQVTIIGVLAKLDAKFLSGLCRRRRVVPFSLYFSCFD